MRLLAFLFVALPLACAAQPVGTISTVAGGNGSGDGAPALSVPINGLGIAIDSQGRIYIAEPKAHRVRRVRTDGTIETLAGTGQPGFSGDGGPAANARLSSPDEVAVDANGNVYVSDAGNARIRRIAADGTISTLAGTGTAGFSGDGGPATAAQFGLLLFFALDDAGNLLVADSDNRRVRRIASGIVTTVAGNGLGGDAPVNDGAPATNARLGSPRGLVADGAGGFYLADWADARVRHVNAAGTITTFAGAGFSGATNGDADGVQANTVFLVSPWGVARDAAGNVYIGQTIRYRIRRVAPDGTISTFAGHPQNFGGGYFGDGGPAAQAGLAVHNLVHANGSLFFAQYVSYLERSRVRRIDAAGIIDAVAGIATGDYVGDGPDALAASLDAHRTSVFPGGDLYSYGETVRHITPAGAISTVAGLKYPRDMVVDAQGNLYYINTEGTRVWRRSPDGIDVVFAGRGTYGQGGDGGRAVDATFYGANALALSRDGTLYIAETGYAYGGAYFPRISRVDPAGIITKVAGAASDIPGVDGALASESGIAAHRMAVDAQGRLLVIDLLRHRLRRIESDGVLSTVAGTGTAGHAGEGGPAASAQLHWPWDVTVDASGNIYVAEYGLETFDYHTNRYVSEPGGRSIRRIAWDTGRIETMAGNGTSDYGGEGIVALGSPLANPLGVASDGARALFITEFGGNGDKGSRVRKLIVGDSYPDAFTFNALNGVPVGTQHNPVR